jgi:dUTP pyrophosphatase
MTNLSSATVTLSKGERIAQLRLVQLFQAHFEEVTELSSTDRGDGGFGSTGS